MLAPLLGLEALRNEVPQRYRTVTAPDAALAAHETAALIASLRRRPAIDVAEEVTEVGTTPRPLEPQPSRSSPVSLGR